MTDQATASSVPVIESMLTDEQEEERQLYESLLDKHIARKVDDAFRRKLQFGRRGSGTTPTSPIVDATSDCSSAGHDSHYQPTVTGEIIPWFVPENQNSVVTSWLQKIDQLGAIYRWSDYEKTCYMQVKLRGSARDWFNRLVDYDKTWDEWKAALQHAFPRCVDYATVLEKLVARKKRPDETMTKYYHAKLALIRQCRLDNEATISCIIKGLPLELQANARAFQCNNPDELYAGFIAAMDNYQTPHDSKRIRRDSEYPSHGSSGRFQRTNRPMRCHGCGKSGHMLRNCHQGRSLICFGCNQQGHRRDECPQRKRPLQSTSQTSNIKLIDQFLVNDVYKKHCRINGKEAQAYFDTGSQVNVISIKCVERLQLTGVSKDNVLRGFGGTLINCSTEVVFTLKIDDFEAKTEEVVTSADMDNIDIIIGQPVINKEGFRGFYVPMDVQN